MLLWGDHAFVSVRLLRISLMLPTLAGRRGGTLPMTEKRICKNGRFGGVPLCFLFS